MDLKLEDKVVIVTGGAKGIGAACVEGFAAEGAVPVIVGRSPEIGRALIEKCGCGTVIQAELTSEEACQNAIAKTLEFITLGKTTYMRKKSSLMVLTFFFLFFSN